MRCWWDVRDINCGRRRMRMSFELGWSLQDWACCGLSQCQFHNEVAAWTRQRHSSILGKTHHPQRKPMVAFLSHRRHLRPHFFHPNQLPNFRETLPLQESTYAKGSATNPVWRETTGSNCNRCYTAKLVSWARPSSAPWPCLGSTTSIKCLRIKQVRNSRHREISILCRSLYVNTC